MPISFSSHEINRPIIIIIIIYYKLRTEYTNIKT